MYLEKMLIKKKCIIPIENKRDSMCCARAIVTAKARLENHAKWEAIRKGLKIQGLLAKELHQLAGVDQDVGCGKHEWDKFQAVLAPRYQLVVVSRNYFNSVIYNGIQDCEKQIYLYHADNHFSVITSMTAFLSKNYYCTQCHKGYQNPNGHRCEVSCPCCYADKRCVFTNWQKCSICNRCFVSENCHAKHMSNGTCLRVKSCRECGKTYHIYNKHRCGYKHCSFCKIMQPIDHECYIQPMDNVDHNVDNAEEKKEKSQRYIFYDFECMLDENKKHVPNLCVAHAVCIKCMQVPMNSDVDCDCKREQRIFEGQSTLHSFCQWLFTDQHRGAIAIAHNAQGKYLFMSNLSLISYLVFK
jgi:hypothetical protein